MIVVGLVLGGSISFANTTGVVILVYLSFLSAIAYALWGVLLKYNAASRVSIFNFSTPIFGVVLSAIFLSGENSQINIVNLVIALAVVSAGILLLNAAPKQKEKSKEKA